MCGFELRMFFVMVSENRTTRRSSGVFLKSFRLYICQQQSIETVRKRLSCKRNLLKNEAEFAPGNSTHMRAVAVLLGPSLKPMVPLKLARTNLEVSGDYFREACGKHTMGGTRDDYG